MTDRSREILTILHTLADQLRELESRFDALDAHLRSMPAATINVSIGSDEDESDGYESAPATFLRGE